MNSRHVEVKGFRTHYVLSAKMSGLTAGEAVKYTVSSGSSSFGSAARAPRSAAQPWSMAFLGDIGRGTAGQKALAARLHQTRPDAVMGLGDLVYPRGRMAEYKYLFDINNADSSDANTGGPSMRSTMWIGVTGNHDTAYRDLTKYPDGLAYYYYWLQPRNGPPLAPPNRGGKASQDLGASANFSFNFGNAHFTVIDSNTYATWSKGQLRAWLENDLASAQDATWRIVGFHHPPFHSGKTHETDTFMRTIVPLLARYKVHLVFSGHVHNYQRQRPMTMDGAKIVMDTNFDGVNRTKAKYPIYLVVGGGGAELNDQSIADKPGAWKPFTVALKAGNSFGFLEAGAFALEYRQVRADGTVVDRFRLTK